MGEMIELGGDARAYLARPAGGSGPGLLVLQEWWGLDWGIKEMADRLAEDGFVALAPDLYRGELADHDEMDKAGHLMSSMPAERAAKDMSVAVDALAALDGVTGSGIGVIGFCMGGMLSFLIAADRPDKVTAIVPFYGFPSGDSEPDWAPMTATVRGHMAEVDSFFGPEGARALEATLRGLGKDVSLTVHAGSGHAFMSRHNALGTYDESLADQVWPEAVAFLRSALA